MIAPLLRRDESLPVSSRRVSSVNVSPFESHVSSEIPNRRIVSARITVRVRVSVIASADGCVERFGRHPKNAVPVRCLGSCSGGADSFGATTNGESLHPKPSAIKAASLS